MTEHEKRLNKNDLVSYKNRDAVSYNLIPGILSSTQSPTDTIIDKKAKWMVNKSVDWDVRTIDEFGNTYLGIPDTWA